MTTLQDSVATEGGPSVVGPDRTWYVAEVPAIVSGLADSRSISSATADTARQLIADGAYDEALSLALREAF